MSREKCLRDPANGGGGGVCQWVPGAEEYGQWIGKAWNERKGAAQRMQYFGVTPYQRPRGCYPVKKNTNFSSMSIPLKDKTKQILSNLPENVIHSLLPAEEARLNIKKPALTPEQKTIIKAKKESRRQKRAEMLAKLHLIKSQKGEGKNKTRRFKKKKRLKIELLKFNF